MKTVGESVLNRQDTEAPISVDGTNAMVAVSFVIMFIGFAYILGNTVRETAALLGSG